MAIVPDQVSSSTEHSRKLLLYFWGAVALLCIVAVIMRLYNLNAPFDRDGYDEGVYWQSLRAMQAGGGLYRTIFYSQPPAFLLTTFPTYILLGGTLWSARFAIALVSLLAFPGAYLLGRSLVGRTGALVALLLLIINPFSLAESQIIQAEASSVAFTFLAIGFAFQWWRQPDGWRGACWAALSGASLVVSILCKLLCVSTLVPLALLMLARIWQIRRKQPGTGKGSWLPILAGVGGALLVALLLLLPFAGAFRGFWNSVVTFHQAAGAIKIPQATGGAESGTIYGNLHQMAPALLSPLTLLAIYGAVTALARRDWRVIPLLAWLCATLALLATFHPLFSHHIIALEPPLIALAVLSVARSVSYKKGLADLRKLGITPAWIVRIATVLVVFASFLNLWQDVQYYRATNPTDMSSAILSPWSGLQPFSALSSSRTADFWQRDLRVANDLRHAITRDQWVITDAQFIAGLADRDTPPALVDTSTVRIDTNYVTLADLEQAASNPRVHAILFYTDRLYTELPEFPVWVAQHFRLLRDYGPKQKLWVR